MLKILKTDEVRFNELKSFLARFQLFSTAESIISKIDKELASRGCKVLPVSMNGEIEVENVIAGREKFFYEIDSEFFDNCDYRYTGIKLYPCVYGLRHEYGWELIYSEISKRPED